MRMIKANAFGFTTKTPALGEVQMEMIIIPRISPSFCSSNLQSGNMDRCSPEATIWLTGSLNLLSFLFIFHSPEMTTSRNVFHISIDSSFSFFFLRCSISIIIIIIMLSLNIHFKILLKKFRYKINRYFSSEIYILSSS